MRDEVIEVKKQMIKGLVDSSIDTRTYEEDIIFTLLGHSNLDYFEYVSGKLLVLLAEKGLEVIDTIKPRVPDPINSALFALRDRTSSIFLNNLTDLLNVKSLSGKELTYIINTSRKYLGSFVDKDKLAKLLKLIISNRKLFIQSNPVLYIHSGGFTPYAHSGHIEAVKHFCNVAIAQNQDSARVILWTYEKNKFKDHKLRPFILRIQDIHRVFHNINTVSIFNYPGSTDGDGQAIMYKILTLLSDNKIRYCIGSDSFIKRMQLLKDKDPTTCLTMQLPNIHFYISLRAGTNINALKEAVLYAKSQKKDVTLVGVQTKVLSGTMLREMADIKAQLYAEGLWFQAENSLI